MRARPLFPGAVLAALAMACFVLGCSGSLGLPLDIIPMGSGLVIVPAPDAESTPSLTLLAERSVGELGGARVSVYGVSGRFARIENSAGNQVCGPGVAALFWVDPAAQAIRRFARFGDPGAGTAAPTLVATAVYENLYPTDELGYDLDWQIARPPRVVITVSGVYTRVDAGSAGTIDNGYSTGAVAFLDLYRPDPVNILSFAGVAGDDPMTLTVLTVDSQGAHTTVTGTGHFTGCSDLLGLERDDPGRFVSTTLAMTNGQVEELSVLGGPPPTAETEYGR